LRYVPTTLRHDCTLRGTAHADHVMHARRLCVARNKRLNVTHYQYRCAGVGGTTHLKLLTRNATLHSLRTSSFYSRTTASPTSLTCTPLRGTYCICAVASFSRVIAWFPSAGDICHHRISFTGSHLLFAVRLTAFTRAHSHGPFVRCCLQACTLYVWFVIIFPGAWYAVGGAPCLATASTQPARDFAAVCGVWGTCYHCTSACRGVLPSFIRYHPLSFNL